MTDFPVFNKAQGVLDYMGRTFVDLRSKSVHSAWKFYLECLFHYQGILREVIGIEVIIERGMKIEEFLKDSKPYGERHHLTKEDKLEAWAELLGKNDTSAQAESESGE